MNPFFSRRALARHLAALALVAGTAAAADSGAPLTQAAAAELAVANQPLLDAQRHAVTAARESAVAAARLPDPVLIGGVSDLMIEGPERYMSLHLSVPLSFY